ncbi:TRAP transporter large permease subunit [Haloechinothrix sp. YIM 98757]|uniref:TRAP transporter large permease subunit n=1 Tax=Haloechinothrix aidingensis TaxID=2752311 RepID=A0A838ABG0_9PSEU|nr:TRAP transporter large permease subunit [Haloechinothrix aidingensis]MBA0126574.1 TRAP transporter large permease subunit [Haloechinothrix aidingensis]
MTGSRVERDGPGTSLAAGAAPRAGVAGGPGAHRKGAWWPRVAAPAVAAICVLLMFGPFTRETVGAAAILATVLLIFLKVPVGIALAAPAVAALYALRGPRTLETMLATVPFDAVSQWTLGVIPMFVFMGLLLARSGVTDTLYTAARHWLGWLPGGLAIGTTAAGTGLAAVSGSTVATTYTLARIGIPEMLRAGYDRRVAVGSVIVAGLPGQLIPPSIFLVIYAGIAQVPVGPQLIAGIGPGLLVAFGYATMILALCRLRPSLAGRGTGTRLDGSTWHTRLRSAARCWPVPVLITAVVGSMFTGVLTATEAGAAGALGALLLTLWYKRTDRPLSAVAGAATDTVATVGSVFLLLIGAMILSRLLAVSGIGTGFAQWVTELGLGRVSFLLLLVAAYLVFGTFMDPLSIMLLTVPLLVPTLDTMDISLLWFGVFVVFLAELAIVTPPVGILSFIVHRIVADPEVNGGQTITLGDIFRAVAWFLPVTLVICVLLIVWPGIATFLPELM